MSCQGKVTVIRSRCSEIMASRRIAMMLAGSPAHSSRCPSRACDASGLFVLPEEIPNTAIPVTSPLAEKAVLLNGCWPVTEGKGTAPIYCSNSVMLQPSEAGFRCSSVWKLKICESS